MQHHHIGKLAYCLIGSIICFALCAFGMTTHFQNVAMITGMLLVLLMTVGFFYATLHLSKVH
jgi:DMSO reductase anchor subunit